MDGGRGQSASLNRRRELWTYCLHASCLLAQRFVNTENTSFKFRTHTTHESIQKMLYLVWETGCSRSARPRVPATYPSSSHSSFVNNFGTSAIPTAREHNSPWRQSAWLKLCKLGIQQHPQFIWTNVSTDNLPEKWWRFLVVRRQGGGQFDIFCKSRSNGMAFSRERTKKAGSPGSTRPSRSTCCALRVDDVVELSKWGRVDACFKDCSGSDGVDRC